MALISLNLFHSQTYLYLSPTPKPAFGASTIEMPGQATCSPGICERTQWSVAFVGSHFHIFPTLSLWLTFFPSANRSGVTFHRIHMKFEDNSKFIFALRKYHRIHMKCAIEFKASGFKIPSKCLGFFSGT